MDDDSRQATKLTRRGFLTQVGVASLATTLRPLEPLRIAGAQPSERSRESFDFGWRFLKGDEKDAQLRTFNDDSWRSIDLPHDWSVEGPFDASEKAQGSLPSGIGWYRKRFHTPNSGQDHIVSLEFDGVYENSEVWINDHYLGKRPSGYTPFYYDLTPFLDRKGENVVAVRVDNSRQPNSRWYSGSGIYRHTWLLSTHHMHIAPWGVYVTRLNAT